VILFAILVVLFFISSVLSLITKDEKKSEKYEKITNNTFFGMMFQIAIYGVIYLIIL
jgi:hypothetical protein